MKTIRAAYPETLNKTNTNRLSFLHQDGDRSIWDDTPGEREAFWEYMYAHLGFGFWITNYKETLKDRAANALVSEFVAKKIRQRLHDAWTAEKLIPKTYGRWRNNMAMPMAEDAQDSDSEVCRWRQISTKLSINRTCASSIFWKPLSSA